jgi:hypothetical protein
LLLLPVSHINSLYEGTRKLPWLNFPKNIKKRHAIFVLTKVNGFAFRLKILYLCSTNVETPRRTGCLHVFYAIFRLKIEKITRRIRKIVSNLVKIVSIVGKIMSILGARRSVINYKTSSVNVKVS